MKSRLVAALGALGLAVLPGCAAKKAEVWMPPPRVEWDDIATPPIEPAANGYRLLGSEPTCGLFPASVGVTRVAVQVDDEKITPRRKYLLRDPRNEFLRWNSAFDDQMAVSEVFPIDQHDLGGAEVEPEQIVAALNALHARVGFVYAVNELSATETEMIGTLYDVGSAKPLATIHARAASVMPPDGQPEPVDLWETDSRALVRARFEGYVYDCIRELIARDEPAVIESPTGWTPIAPTRPVEWPPRHSRPL